MKKVFIILTISIPLTVLGQRDSMNHEQKKFKILHFFTWGLPSNWGEDNPCIIDLRKRYGFDEEIKAACIVKRGQVRRWERHNNRIERKMEQRHGSDWHKKYDSDVANCLR